MDLSEEDLRPSADNISKEKIKAILNLLKEGESIKYESHKSITLFLGNTGSGKSTLTQFIAGDNNKLISQEVGAASGEYIIIDNDNRISGNSTITSQTVFPEMVKDSNTINNVYYDCPGFSDTRSLAHDVTVTYFIKKIIDSSDSIKLVFVISYPSVRVGVDRQDFMLLVKHATDMIKNIEKFEDSIALIVTKVDNETRRYKKNYVMVPDITIINKIGDYLMLVRKDLVNKSINKNYLNDQVFNEKAIKFIDILLSKKEGEYSRIGIFRRPDEAGLISQISLLQEGKIKITEILTNNINFVNHVENDFGYTISSESKNYIHELNDEITKAVNLNVGNIGNCIKKYYLNLEKEKFDLEYLYKQLEIGYTILREMTDANKFVRPRDIITPLIKLSETLNIKSGKYLYEISNYDKFLEFIKKVNKASTTNQVIWLHNLTSVINYVGSSKRWYRFMLDIFNRLSEYDVQRNKAKFNTNNIKQKISYAKHKIGENKEVKAEDIDLTQLIEQFHDNKLFLDYDEVKHSSIINEPKLNALKQLLDDALNFKIETYYPSNNTLTIRGHFIKLSDIIDKANSDKVEVIEILALYKLFIDASIDKKGRGAKILIIAPIWQIIQNQTFLLDGKDGEDIIPSKASNGDISGERGSDGESGKPGGSAGHFFGIGKTFIDGENLIVHANGGHGGTGQTGGDGANGKVGYTYPLPDESYDLNHNYNNSTEYTILSQRKSWSHFFLFFGKINKEWTTLKLPGGRGGYGGDGGNGGIGGEGGYNGTVELIEMGKNSNILIKNSNGKRGNPGTGGFHGYGGRGGDDLEIRYYREWGSSSKFSYSSTEYSYSGNNTGFSGEYGVNGASHKNEKQPIKIPFSNIPQTINNYKNYLKENLDGSANAELLKSFQKQLDTDKRIMGYYDAANLVLEFEQLENVSNKIKDKKALLIFYDSLLRRIDDYSTNSKVSDRTDEYKKVISYLYTAVLSKICNMDNRINSSLNLDLQNYLETLIKSVNEIKEKNDIKLSVDDIIDGQNKLNVRLSDLRSFFDSRIQSLLKMKSDNTDKQTELLLAEMATVDTVTSTAEDVSIIEDEVEEDDVLSKELKSLENEEKLNDATVTKTILNYLQLSQQYLIILTKLTSALNIGQSIIVNNSILLDEFPQEKVDEISASFSSVQDSLKLVESGFENVLTFFTQQLYDVKRHLNDFLQEHPKSTLNEINSKILFTIEKLKTINDETKIDFIKKDLLKIISLMKNSIQLNPTLNDSGVEEMILLDVIENILNVEYSSWATYENNKDELLKINKLARSFNGEILNKIKGYKKHLYQIINIQGIEEKVKDIIENIEFKKTADIKIEDWNIKRLLKDMKKEIKEVLEEFDKDEDLNYMMEKIQLSITLLIDIYDEMYSINNQAIMGTYISDITSIKSTEINVTNEELIKIINKLNNLIKMNLITGKYNEAVNAVKKHIFPFAKNYIDDLSLPINNNNNKNKNIAEYADLITSEIKNFKNKNLKSTNLLGTYDRYIHNGIEFNSQYQQMSPFFIWRYKNIKKSLFKLLEGEEITLVADLFKGVQKNVIKFNEIGIRFKVKNDNLQKHFDGVLSNFGVTLVHQGDSHYRCDDKIFIMVSNKKNIYYTFNTKTNGEPVDKNIVYDKLKNSHLVLSPYATWSIQLKNVTDTFEVLKGYKEKEIDIELKGYGQYIDKEVDLCSEEFENDYQQDESLSVLENQFYNENLKEGSFKDVNIRKRRSLVLENDFNNFRSNLQFLEGTEVKNLTEFNVTNIQSNLLLLDLMVKMKMKNKIGYKKGSFKLDKNIDNRFAHNLAYRAYIPKN